MTEALPNAHRALELERRLSFLSPTTLGRWIVALSIVCWITLAGLSRLRLSDLQQTWSIVSVYAMFVYFPLCIACGGLALIRVRRNRRRVAASHRLTPVWWLFLAVIILFAAQCIVTPPPALSGDPNVARLSWGLKYVHVLSEILIRTAVLAFLGRAVTVSRFSKRAKFVVVLSLLYTLLVVSRSFLLEILVYLAGAWALMRYARGRGLVSLRSAMAGAAVIAVFIAFGNWRQGRDFNMREYAELKRGSGTLGWLVGYTLITYDNLALVIDLEYRNTAASNVIGPFLQTLQVRRYNEVDDYPYVGKFNLGTGLRPYVLDKGVWMGGGVFALCWILALGLARLCYYPQNQVAISLGIAYMGVLLPITGRIEEPAYLFPLLLIVVVDKLFRLLRPTPRAL